MFGSNELKEFKKRLKDGKAYAIGGGTYLGGHPEHTEAMPGGITVKHDGVFFYDLGKKYFIIEPQDIVSAQFQTHKEISKHVTLGRVLLLGIFALAAKKKRAEDSSYMTLKFRYNNSEVELLFESKEAGKLASAINKLVSTA